MKRMLLVAVLASLSSVAAKAQVGLVQHNQNDSGGSVTSLSIPFKTNNAQGNWLGVCIRSGQPNQTLTVSDSRNTYKPAVVFPQTADGDTTAIFYAENSGSGANTVTINGTVLGTLRAAIMEFSGLAQSGSLDAKASGQANTAALSSGTVNTTAAGELALGCLMTANTHTFTPGIGFTAIEQVGQKVLAEYLVQGAGVATATATASITAADNWAAGVATFRQATVTPPKPQPPTMLATTIGPLTIICNAAGTYTISPLSFTCSGPGTIKTVLLTWTATGTCTGPSGTVSCTPLGYNIYRGTASGGPYTLVGTISSTSFTDTTVSSGLTYFYVVTGYLPACSVGQTTPCGESGYSNQASVLVQ